MGGYAQEVFFHHLTPEDGLAQSTVLSITEDGDGFMWFGTPSGLSRFDSRQIRNFTYNPKDTGSIPSNNIMALFFSTRHGLLVGTEFGLCRYDPVSDRFYRLFAGAGPGKGLSDNSIRSITEDNRGNVWVGTHDGLSRIEFGQGAPKVTRFIGGMKGTQCRVYDIAVDPEGRIWAASTLGLFRVSLSGDRSEVEKVMPGNGPEQVGEIWSLHNDGENLWAGTSEGRLMRFNYKGKQFSQYHSPGSGGKFSAIQKILGGKDGSLWVGTINGLYHRKKGDEVFRAHVRSTNDQRTINDDGVWSGFCDRKGTLWFGTYYGGVNYAHPERYPFHTLKLNTVRSPGGISKIIKDGRGDIWLNSYTYGAIRIDAQTNQAEWHTNPQGNPEAASVIYPDRDGNIWVGRHSFKNFSRYNRSTKTWQHFSLDLSQSVRRDHHFINAFLHDSRGRFWIGTSRDGLYLFDPKTGSSRQILSKHKGKLRSIASLMEDKKGNIWFSGNPGIGVLRASTGKVEWFSILLPDYEMSGKGIVMCMHEDVRGDIWLGTFSDGIKKYDAAKNTFVRAGNGVLRTNNTVLNIISDSQGYLWMSDDLGLARWHPEKNIIQYYSMADGLPGQEIVERSAFRDETGEIYFGTNNGVFHFNPASIPITLAPPAVAFTGLKLFNRPVAPGDASGVLSGDIGRAKRITLRHDQSVFTVDFAVLNFIRAEKNRYAYRLEGFEENWNYVPAPSATYTNLSPGNYTLLIKGANQDGIWNERPTRLEIAVLPPWYKTWWAYLLYTVIFAGALFGVMRFFWLRESFKRDHELHQAKLDFFTNISHEIRTHLSLILGPVERILTEKNDVERIHDQLRYVKSNSEQLRGLVTELLDFRKAESRQMQLHAGKGELISFLSNIFEAFGNLAAEKEIESVFETRNPKTELWYDPEQLTKVVFNLLVNAYKFTPKGGTVKLEVEETNSHVLVRVSDNGRGIAPQHLSNLFKNFFQVYEYNSQNTGYGIGLALSKTIVEMHKGKLSVVSREAHGAERGLTIFTVELLKGHAHFAASQLVDGHRPAPLPVPLNGSDEVPELVDKEEQYPTILIVEDHEELRSFIRSALEGTYRILEAGNGVEGLGIAREHIPDLIVSDVMMAEMDGLQLCEKVKSDELTSHIPVILLTAKASDDHKIQGLEKGADAYLTKPFSTRVFELCIHNLLAAQRLMREKYARSITLEPNHVEIDDLDEKFLRRIITITDEFMSEPDFGVDKLSKEAGMSIPILYKKLKGITGLSVNDFTKTLRLKKAAQLLEQGHYNVNEVANLVGYSDRRYFTKEFGRMFGKAPSEIRRATKEGENL
jgi:ligand-binding sensor domain-containing protein/signal transduction histidine kinase/DNA-binding NarL/FixJ family response regulator